MRTDGQVTRYAYDGFGRRASLSSAAAGTRGYLWDGDDLFAELSAAGALTAEYTTYPGIDRPHSVRRGGSTSYYATDELGSVLGLFGGSGVQDVYRYDPWGKLTSASETVTNRLGFAARELDVGPGLYYLRARYYDPDLGRFISQDPLGLSAGINPYAYAGDDPVNAADPTGMYCVYLNHVLQYCVLPDVHVAAEGPGGGGGPSPSNGPDLPNHGPATLPPGSPSPHLHPGGGGSGFSGFLHKVAHFVTSHADCEEAIGFAALNGALDAFGGREVLGGLKLTTGFVRGFFENRALARTGFTFARKFLGANLRDAGAAAARTVGADVRGAAEATATISVAETVTTFHLPSVGHAAREFAKALVPGIATGFAIGDAIKTCGGGGG